MVRQMHLGTLLGMLALAAGAGQAEEKKFKLPAAGTEFRFSPEQPKYVTCDVEFRDATEAFWPCFFYGKPAAGTTVKIGAAGPTGTFSLLCDQMTQKNGDQGRRVLGELVKDGKPPVVRLTIKELGPLQTEPAEAGSKSKKETEFASARAELEVAGKKVPVQAKALFTWKFVKGGESAESVAVELRFRVQPADLGLTRIEGPIECRAGITGYVKK